LIAIWRSFLVADFADHDLVRVVTPRWSAIARKRQTFFSRHGNLRDAASWYSTGSFDGDDFVFVCLDFR